MNNNNKKNNDSIITISSYKCPNIKNMIKKLEEKTKKIQSINKIKFTKEMYLESLNKLKNNEVLKISDMEVLLIWSDTLELDGYYQLFFEKLNNSNYNIKILIKPILNTIYSNKISKENLENLYLYLYKNIDLVDSKYLYSNIVSIINKSISIQEYEKNIYQEVELSLENKEINTSLDIINSTFNKYLINRNHKIYLNFIFKFIEDNYKENILWGLVETIILNNNEFEIIKQLIENVLLKIHNEKLSIEKYPDKFFIFTEKMLVSLKDKPNRWDNISNEAKEIFRIWYIQKDLKEFFETKAGGDERRLKFWRAYIKNIKNVYFNEYLDNALIMKFDKYWIIEFAKQNNATYIYTLDSIDETFISNGINYTNDSRYYYNNILKDKELAYKRLHHTRNWEYKFATELRILGYERDIY